MTKKLGPRGFRVTDNNVCVYWIVAESAAKAKYRMFEDARRAEHRLLFKHIECKRCPALDDKPIGFIEQREIQWDDWMHPIFGRLPNRPEWEPRGFWLAANNTWVASDTASVATARDEIGGE